MERSLSVDEEAEMMADESTSGSTADSAEALSTSSTARDERLLVVDGPGPATATLSSPPSTDEAAVSRGASPSWILVDLLSPLHSTGAGAPAMTLGFLTLPDLLSFLTFFGRPPSSPLSSSYDLASSLSLPRPLLRRPPSSSLSSSSLSSSSSSPSSPSSAVPTSSPSRE